MTDTCIVSEPTGASTQSETTGRETPVYADLFTSRCRVTMQPYAAVTQVLAGGREAAMLRPVVKLPVTAPVVAPECRVRMIAVGPESDPALVGRVFVVRGTPVKSHATTRLLDVEEVG